MIKLIFINNTRIAYYNSKQMMLLMKIFNLNKLNVGEHIHIIFKHSIF